ncbi:ATP-binding protein [Iodobacter sp. CM08]|uniref:ATP-binding protein n=1 Tax=Iodobacter sp. CM08 TaxID=3085902 RepID=UPI002981D1A3|nr:ATP-binding protein [Iodobacter sp. CM08]MDW5415477.1 ATP-binding protein [Iodobacter sp. CM08]
MMAIFHYWKRISLQSRFYILLLHCLIGTLIYGYMALHSADGSLPIDAAKLRMTGVFIATFISALVLISLLSHSVTQAMSDIYEGLNQINDHHDWNMRLKVYGNDEFSKLADQLNYLFANMEQLDQRIKAKTIHLEEMNKQLRDEVENRQKIEMQLEKKTEAQALLIERLGTTQIQLAQAEKMASIGQLAAGVAHEINNPIGFISSNLNTLNDYSIKLVSALDEYKNTEHIDDEIKSAIIKKNDLAFIFEDLPDLVKESKDGLERVKVIVRDLKDFSHVDSGEWSAVDINKAIDNTINMAKNEIKSKAEITVDYAVLPNIEIIGSQFNQVILNLLINAAQSINSFGKILIRTRLHENNIYVDIRDNGSGISPEHLTRIFDPFFTTKPVGKGTGLGLSLAFGLMKKMHGEISVRSEINKGSCFTLRIPVNAMELNKSEVI